MAFFAKKCGYSELKRIWAWKRNKRWGGGGHASSVRDRRNVARGFRKTF